ncbi:predicted glycosyltransferases [Longilinea arvoryzae]|uniref:Predicted glycosyltransferases n=1 Tax=Longilinea arvoryzae TaxID=360412 RepID=A0A0S7BHZ8_9CHLR|nr:glycosyltransferase family 2 protein [Longilinea arvoryzae]GAP13473.1 predicted glycosyltransferases [Longilinea arvoryzae]
MKNSIAAVILNWKKPADTLLCLETLGDKVSAVVVDNGSQDGSVERIRMAKPDVPLISLEKNNGYAGGNNAGIIWALAQDFEWILLINEDALLPPEALDRLVKAARQDPRVGFAGPLILHAQPENVIQSAGGLLDERWRASHRGQNQVDEGQYTHPEEVRWLSGCVLLVRARMVREIGMLDERFFLYEEELEWCLRGAQAGWKALFVPSARASHAGVSLEYEPQPYVTYYMTRNHFLLLSKQGAGLLPWSDAILSTLRTLASWTFKPKWRSKNAHRNAMWLGMLDFARRHWGEMKETV